jgi:hypothetical protein
MPEETSPKNWNRLLRANYCADLIDDDWPDAGIVVDPPRRAWFLAAVSLVLTAIAAAMVSKRFAGLGMMTMARSAQAMNDGKQYARIGVTALAQVKADESAMLKPIAFRDAHRSDDWGLVSLGLFGLAAACWSVSHCRSEGGSPVLLSALFIFYVLLLMLIV